MKERTSKVLGIRLEKDLIDDFERACQNLPMALKPQEILKAYIRSVVEVSKDIEADTLHIAHSSNNVVIINPKATFQKIHITRGLYDINFR